MRRLLVDCTTKWTVTAMPPSLRRRWDRPGEEPSLAEMLSDPVVDSVLRRDGLTPDDVMAVMNDARIRLRDPTDRKVA